MTGLVCDLCAAGPSTGLTGTAVRGAHRLSMLGLVAAHPAAAAAAAAVVVAVGVLPAVVVATGGGAAAALYFDAAGAAAAAAAVPSFAAAAAGYPSRPAGPPLTQTEHRSPPTRPSVCSSTPGVRQTRPRLQTA